MRIDSALPNYNFDALQTASRRAADPVESQKMSYYSPGVVVEISQQAKDAYNKSIQPTDRTNGVTPSEGVGECQTCKNRKYVDGSNDPSVSYQAPTHIGPNEAAGKVMAHEREHVTNEQARADREDRRVISQTVSITTSVCPECGRVYVSGGVTRTVTASDNKNAAQAVQQENNNNTGEKDA